MPEANLLVTFDPVHKESAKVEIEALIKGLGESFKIIKIEEGLTEISVKEPRKIIKSLIKVREKDSSRFKYTFNWWPVDEWCKADIKEMQKIISKIEKNISQKDKWKMDFSKRQTTKDYGKDIIFKLTDAVDKPKVDLSNPDKIIKVDIIRDKAALSILAKDEFLSTLKAK